ncbi:hypothetical protein [Catenuloplanes indicus]|uniref:Uncharacterized protein n=1 Tax=Catenuloplanes indicus TaxID=137267 RepID=A0AAE4AZ20_9ACTN|nr:hypothetical protein [Catenuloplanes indicus]MDQ0367984.1 hypothetical protein [Catenuloplanes indicus]
MRIPSPPLDYPAGPHYCVFHVHGEPIVDEVYYKVLTTEPDGTPRIEAAFGPLIYRLTNVATGATVDGDASASGMAIHHDDGSTTHLAHGPLMVGFREGQGNLPRGYYVIDGPAWRLDISPDNHRTVSGAYRIRQNLCDDLS